MKRSMTLRLQLAFAVIFVLVCIGLLFVRPPSGPAPNADAQARCEARGDWWDDKDKLCAVPVPLSTITGRPAAPRQP